MGGPQGHRRKVLAACMGTWARVGSGRGCRGRHRYSVHVQVRASRIAHRRHQRRRNHGVAGGERMGWQFNRRRRTTPRHSRRRQRQTQPAPLRSGAGVARPCGGARRQRRAWRQAQARPWLGRVCQRTKPRRTREAPFAAACSARAVLPRCTQNVENGEHSQMTGVIRAQVRQ
eukprot:gene860-biopygen1647